MEEYKMLELRLKKFTPRNFSSEAKDRLLHQLLISPPRNNGFLIRISWWAGGFAVAAALSLAFFLWLNYYHNLNQKQNAELGKENSPSDNIRLVSADTEVVSEKSHGVVKSADGTFMQIKEYNFVDTVEIEHVPQQRHIKVVRPRYGIVLTGIDVD